MKNKIILVLGVISLFLLTSCTQEIMVEEHLFCNVAEDCVPATCCHPTEAVNINFAPECEDVMCTMDCRPGTLDCGQGYIDCIDNTCTAVITE